MFHNFSELVGIIKREAKKETSVILGCHFVIFFKVFQFFCFQGSIIVQTPSQDETDFTKGLHVMLQTLKERNMQEEVRK